MPSPCPGKQRLAPHPFWLLIAVANLFVASCGGRGLGDPTPEQIRELAQFADITPVTSNTSDSDFLVPRPRKRDTTCAKQKLDDCLNRCQAGDAWHCLRAAREFDQRGKKTRMRGYEGLACQLGSAEACGDFARNYTEDAQLSGLAWLLMERACDAGDRDACTDVFGRNLKRSPDDVDTWVSVAKRSIQLCEEQDIAHMCIIAAESCYLGFGVGGQDEVCMNKYYRKACDLGLGRGCSALEGQPTADLVHLLPILYTPHATNSKIRELAAGVPDMLRRRPFSLKFSYCINGAGNVVEARITETTGVEQIDELVISSFAQTAKFTAVGTNLDAIVGCRSDVGYRIMLK